MADSRTMQSLLKRITEAMVDRPEQVRIDCCTEGNSHQYRVHVAPEDLGKIIGKQGRSARAIREILACASNASNARFTLEIVEQLGRDKGTTQSSASLAHCSAHFQQADSLAPSPSSLTRTVSKGLSEAAP